MSASSGRFLLLDVMRAFAVLMMIQGHTIDALLAPSAYNPSSPLYQIWQIGRGLTAPIFLFGSGFAYVYATSRKTQGTRMPAALFLRRLRWIALLFFMGALMHFPSPGLMHLPAASDSQWNMFFRVDVLRLMAVSLLGLLTLLLIARTPRSLFLSSSFLAVAIVSITPLMHTIPWANMLHPAAAGFLSMGTGSYFPLFPFAGYLFGGAAAASWYLQRSTVTRDRDLLIGFGVLGGIMAGSAWILESTYYGMLGGASPALFSLRIGIVLTLWAVIGTAIRSVRVLPSTVQTVGQHTLLIYVSHVVILYGSPWTPGLKAVLGQYTTFAPVLAVIVSLLVISASLAHTMQSMKHERAEVYRFVPYAGMALLAGVLIIM